MGRRLSVAMLAMVVVAAASADEIHLKSGGRLSGMIVDQTPTSVEIEVGAGRVTVPRSLISRIVPGESALSVYHARARALSPTDVAGWLDLAEWARSRDLSGQARDAYLRVLSVDPNNAAARHALDYQRVGGDWLSRDEAMQARGYVWFDGAWMTPVQRDSALAERDAARRERAESARSRLAVAEAEARAREAEARARTAEADAKRAEEERAAIVPVWAGYPVSPWFPHIQPCCNGTHAIGQCPRRRHHEPYRPITRFTFDLGRHTAPAVEATPTPPPPVRHKGASAAVAKK